MSTLLVEPKVNWSHAWFSLVSQLFFQGYYTSQQIFSRWLTYKNWKINTLVVSVCFYRFAVSFTLDSLACTLFAYSIYQPTRLFESTVKTNVPRFRMDDTVCRNPFSDCLTLSSCGFLPVMVTASDWWLLSVTGLRLWLRALLLAYFLLTSQQLTQSISALLNPFGSQDTPAKHIILRHAELSTAPKKAQQIRVTTCRGHLKTIFIIKGERTSERGSGLTCGGSEEVTWWDFDFVECIFN